MTRRRYTREFKVEAVKLVTERGVTMVQASRNLGVHINTLRGWIRDFQDDG